MSSTLDKFSPRFRARSLVGSGALRASVSGAFATFQFGRSAGFYSTRLCPHFNSEGRRVGIVVAALASDCCNAAALPSPERRDFTVVRRISLSDQRAEHPPLRSRPPGVHESPAHRVHPGASTGCTRCRRRRPVAKRAQTIRTSMRNFYNVERIDPSRRRARRESVRWSRAEARTRSAGHMLQEHNSR